MKRRPLTGLCEAIKRYGDVTVMRPSYVPEGHCENCGKKIEGSRKKSFCSTECRVDFNRWVTWNRGRGGYSTHILRRDNFTCQDCGEIHRGMNEYGVELPVSDGELEVHHIEPVSEGGQDNPENLITLCKACHKERHRKLKNNSN